MKPKPSADPYTVAQQALHDAQLALASIPRPPPPTPNPTPPSRASTRAARCTSCEQLRAKLVSIEASAGAQKQQVGLLSAAIDRAKARERELRRECERLLARIGELEATPERALRVSDQRTVPREVQVEMLPVEFDDANNLVGSAWTSTAALSALASTSQRQEEEEEEGHDHFRHYRRPTRKPERPRKRAKLAEEDEASSPLSSASVSTPNPNPKPAPTKRKPPLCAILAAARHPPQAPNRQRHGTAFGARLPALLVEDDAYLFELPGEVWGDDDDAAALGGGDAHEQEYEHGREGEGEGGGGGGADNGGEEEQEYVPPPKKSHKKQPRKVPAYDYEHRRSRVVVPAPAQLPAGDAVSTGESESPSREEEKEKEEPHALETPGVFFTLKF
ncbi:hypothetical protein B0H11DRAFT_1008171 [Mycena galericulata]|nr:hypothetical protein B0H11DRAFT_1008171 [Mycena galericulata]